MNDGDEGIPIGTANASRSANKSEIGFVNEICLSNVSEICYLLDGLSPGYPRSNQIQFYMRNSLLLFLTFVFYVPLA